MTSGLVSASANFQLNCPKQQLVKLPSGGKSTERGRIVRKVVKEPLTIEEMRLVMNIKTHNRSLSKDHPKLGSPPPPSSRD